MTWIKEFDILSSIKIRDLGEVLGTKKDASENMSLQAHLKIK